MYAHKCLHTNPRRFWFTNFPRQLLIAGICQSICHSQSTIIENPTITGNMNIHRSINRANCCNQIKKSFYPGILQRARPECASNWECSLFIFSITRLSTKNNRLKRAVERLKLWVWHKRNNGLVLEFYDLELAWQTSCAGFRIGRTGSLRNLW